MNTWKKIEIMDNILDIDPSIQGNTKLLLNGLPFVEINGTIDKQISILIYLISNLNITEININTRGYGAMFYEEFKNTYNSSTICYKGHLEDIILKCCNDSEN
jgi:hypothetical protein